MQNDQGTPRRFDRDDNSNLKRDDDRTADRNPDPITGAPGSHPVGTGIGAAAGGIAGAAIGAIGGPIGVGIGAAVGAVAGGLAGKGGAEAVNPTVETEYWRQTYRSRPYVSPDAAFDDFEPAYRYGWESYGRTPGRPFNEVEPELQNNWAQQRGPRGLEWGQAREAVRDAWTRMEKRPSQMNDREVTEVLNDLVEVCNDGAMGFRTSAEKVSPNHAAMFRELGAERERLAKELQQEVVRRGGNPERGGDAPGALHRGWINIKSALSSGDKAIVNEAERGEDTAVEAYEKAMKRELPGDVRALLQRQYTTVKAAHDKVRSLRDSLK